MKTASYTKYPANATVAIPSPGNARLNRLKRVNGPVDRHCSLCVSEGQNAAGLAFHGTNALDHGSRDCHSLLVVAWTRVLLSNPVGFGGAMFGEQLMGWCVLWRADENDSGREIGEALLFLAPCWGLECNGFARHLRRLELRVPR